MARLLVAALAVSIAASAPSPQATDWPQWRGPDGLGVSGASGVPGEWSATKNVRWKTAIPGRGHSSPIVLGERVFLTTAVEGDAVPGAKATRHVIDGQDFLHPDAVGADRKQTLKVLALDAKSGKLLWERTAWEGTPYDSRHRKGSFASPTPATDGQRVYAYFGAEGLYAYELDGKLAWKVALPGVRTLGVGTGTSPVVWRDKVIVLCDEDNGEQSFLAAFDARTGKQAWRTPRQVQISWATPILVSARLDAGSGAAAVRDELIAAGTELNVAYDPQSGKELWRAKGLDSNAVPSPVAGHGLVVLSTGYPSKLALAIRPGGSGDVSDSPRVVWRYTKGTAYVPSPVLYGDYLYLLTDKGLLTALDARTGTVQYEGARVPTPASFTASPVAFDGKLLLLSEDGDGFLIKAGPKHEVLATNPLGEPVFASPAIAAGRLYIRGLNHLFCIG